MNLSKHLELISTYFSTLPYGVGSQDSFQSKLQANNPKDYKEDQFHTVENRHTYFKRPKLPLKRKIRLRARQVLCHSCKNVCNELGQNAQGKSDLKRSQSSKKFDNLCVKTFTLVPKVKRLKVNEIEKFNQIKEKPTETSESMQPLDHQQNSGIEYLTPLKIKILPEVRNLRKKKSLGSMEDLWDEAIFEDKIRIPIMKPESKSAKKAMKRAAKKEAKRFSKKLKKAKKLNIHSENYEQSSSIRKSCENEVVKIPLKLGVVPIMPSPTERRLASPIHCVS